jgi:hypothetical protein
MSVISETRERFLRAIANTIPAERVIEIHFFQPIRQGGVESGVAVIAAALELESTPDDMLPPKAPALDDVPVARGEIVFADRAPVGEGAAMLSDSIPLELTATEVTDGSAGGAGDRSEADPEENGADAAEPPPPRYTVYSAKYRLVLKGPERGKWETQIVAEADAPLVTVVTVVRGVQRRSGDLEVAELMKGEEVRARLGLMVAAR